MRRKWWKQAVAAIVLAGVLIAAMSITVPDENRELTPVESGIRDLTAPILDAMSRAGGGLWSGVRSVFTLGRSAEIDELRERIRDLEGELVSVEELRLENERLRELLDYRNEQDNNLLLARVIGRDPSNWFQAIRLNRGAADGIRTNMPVVLPSGLVGRVLDVAEHSSTVLLITDPQGGVGTLVQETRTPGVVKGNLDRTGHLVMSYLTREHTIEPGQAVVTSGLGEVFPSGIPVGRIIEVQNDPSGLTQTAEIVPMVDFNRLEEVYIILTP